MSDTKKAYLILADGTVFEGNAIGARGKTIGETVFTTGMTGYLETLTDPSYFGQIVTQTFPLIGNYGVISEDFESKKSWVRGYVVRELCDEPSNFRCEGDLDSFLKKQGIVGIAGIDTRRLTKILREAGVMNGMIVSGDEAEKIEKNVTSTVVERSKNGHAELDRFRCGSRFVSTSAAQEIPKQIQNGILEEIRAYKIENAVKSVQQIESGKVKTEDSMGEVSPSATMASPFSPTPSAGDTPATPPSSQFSVVLFDFGAKANIQCELKKRDCKVTVVPYDTTAEKIIALAPDGIMLSNGPGDPAENVNTIEEIRKLCEWNKETRRLRVPKSSNEVVSTGSTTTLKKPIPIFGICLGHQMLALARGAKTSKLKYGHRGGNQPVKDLESGRVFISSQNHGYAVENDSLPSCAKLRFVNTNDGTCEGIEYTDIPAFSVQFHPEACSGPHDTNFLFDLFLEMMKNATE